MTKKLLLAVSLCFIGLAANASPIMPIAPVARPSINVMPIMTPIHSTMAAYKSFRLFWLSRGVVR